MADIESVFIAEVCWEHEGCEIIGVFETHELAKSACDSHKYGDGSIRGDFRSVTKYEMNKDVWIEVLKEHGRY